MPRYIGYDPTTVTTTSTSGIVAGMNNTAVTFLSGNTGTYIDSTYAEDGKVFIAYTDGTAFVGPKAVIATVNQTTGGITFGNSYVATSNNGTYTSIDYIGNNKIFMAWRDASDSNKGRARVATVSGTTVSYGPLTTFETSVTNKEIYVRKASSNSVVMTYGNTSVALAKVANVASDDSITFGSGTTVGAVGDEYVSMSRLNDAGTRFLRVAQTSSLGKGSVLNIVGTTINKGSDQTFNANTTLHLASTEYDTDKAVVVWVDSTGLSKPNPIYPGKMSVFTMSGNTITVGPVKNFTSDNPFENDVVMITSNTGFVASGYQQPAYISGVIPFGVDSNEIIYVGNQKMVQNNSTATISVAKAKAGQAVISFGGGNYANAMTVTINDSYDLKAANSLAGTSTTGISGIFSMNDPQYSQYNLKIDTTWPDSGFTTPANTTFDLDPFQNVTYTGIYDILTTSSPGTYTASKTGKHAIIVVSGGGTGAHDNGAGGGGGRITYGEVDLTSGSPYSYSVGSGGGSAASGTPASTRDGGTSVFAPGQPYALTASGVGTGVRDGGGGSSNGGDGGSGGGAVGPGGSGGSQGRDFGPNYGPPANARGGYGQGAYYRRGIALANALLPAPSGHSIANGAGGAMKPSEAFAGGGGGGIVIDGDTSISPSDGESAAALSGVGYGAGGGGGPGGLGTRQGHTGANGVILIIG